MIRVISICIIFALGVSFMHSSIMDKMLILNKIKVGVIEVSASVKNSISLKDKKYIKDIASHSIVINRLFLNSDLPEIKHAFINYLSVVITVENDYFDSNNELINNNSADSIIQLTESLIYIIDQKIDEIEEQHLKIIIIDNIIKSITILLILIYILGLSGKIADKLIELETRIKLYKR